MVKEERHIVFFDGVCNFCNATVDWIWKKNKKEDLSFSSLQSDFAKQFLAEYGIVNADLNTIYFYKNQKLFEQSTAVFHIMLHFGRISSFFAKIGLIIPATIRNSVYRVIAKRRYKLAGKRETCRIPQKHELNRFIEKIETNPYGETIEGS